MSLFGRKDGGSSRPAQDRSSRHSSGWAQMLKHLKSTDGLRVLDIGPTSSSNINFLTGLGHSIYMASVVPEAAEFRREGADGVEYDVDGFLSHNLSFSGRVFDVVMLWDALDYLPEPLVAPTLARLLEVMTPGAQMLAYFHSKPDGPETVFTRYHLTETEDVSMQRVGGFTVLQTFTNRQVEQMLKEYASYRFFLAKDALREVMVTR
ncbi:Methyltransferase domain-containing protein [Granulicella rosea]|uniref:Methyltransferase domain-containing protein n=1 Tax=Granulicella rosea TaxID=474952 RepID=A0A239IUA3_9BACT|nr:methyltransferase domain-containing protein [Granulicella rosea]SNS97171.1 Methyltransferase domain-containing protein [Granulicella rosea]